MVLVRRRGAGTRDIQTHVVVEAVKVSELASQQASQLLLIGSIVNEMMSGHHVES